MRTPIFHNYRIHHLLVGLPTLVETYQGTEVRIDQNVMSQMDAPEQGSELKHLKLDWMGSGGNSNDIFWNFSPGFSGGKMNPF